MSSTTATPMSTADRLAHEAASYAPTAPLPSDAADAVRRLELKLASPVGRLRLQIARLEGSLRIQCEGRDSDLARMQDIALPALKRAEAEGSYHSTLREITFILRQLAELKAALMAVARFQTAASTYRMLSAQTAWMAPGEFDRLLNAQDTMRQARDVLAAAGRLDLIGAA